MIRVHVALLLLSLLLPASPLIAQSHGDTNDDEFWKRFEDRVNAVVDRVIADFSVPRNDSAQSAERPGWPVQGIFSFTRDTVLAAGDTLRGDLTVSRCTLTIEGTVVGAIQAHRATIRLRSGGHVTGDIAIFDGEFSQEEGSLVDGALNKRYSLTLEDDYDREFFPTRAPSTQRLPWIRENMFPPSVNFRYNRVEGIFLGVGSKKKFYWNGERDFGVFGSTGYGFKAHRWRANLGLTRQFASVYPTTDRMFEVGAEVYSLTDTRDQWLIGTGENTAAAFFIHEDFRDYFVRNGATAHVAYYVRGDHLFSEARLAFLADRYGSLAAKTDWSLFGGDKGFRQNPAIDDGRMRSVMAVAGLSSLRDYHAAPEGWTAYGTAEFASRSALGGEFTFNQYVVDVRRFQPVGRYDNFNLRVRVGTSSGPVPRQKTFELGGLSTLPGYGFKIFPGDSAGANRMILFNGEYIVNGDILDDLEFWPSWLMRYINILLLADAGLVRSVGPEVSALDGFGGLRWGDFKSDLGVGVGNRSGSFRLAMSWRTDRAESPRFIFRFSRPF